MESTALPTESHKSCPVYALFGLAFFLLLVQARFEPVTLAITRTNNVFSSGGRERSVSAYLSNKFVNHPL